MLRRFFWNIITPEQLSRIVQQIKHTPRGTKTLATITGLGGVISAFWYSSTHAIAFGYIEECVPPPKYPWGHNNLWKSYDHAAIRRGFQVYNTIGSPCHSMKYRYYRQLIDVAYTEEEAKAIAENYDGYFTPPDDEGDVHERTGTINDKFHSPYDNDKQARALNNGALPPDLSQIVRARDGVENYIISLLLGYRDPPHGIIVGDNMNYNIYFPGCQIAMPAPLAEGAVEFDDGTEASVSQQAKDVSVFLAWSAFMEHDERHLMGVKSLTCLALLFVPLFYWKRFKFSYIKKRKVELMK